MQHNWGSGKKERHSSSYKVSEVGYSTYLAKLKGDKHVQKCFYSLSRNILFAPWTIDTRVSKVVADHDDLLTHWKYMLMSKLRTNLCLIQTTSNYFVLPSSEPSKIGHIKLENASRFFQKVNNKKYASPKWYPSKKKIGRFR